MGSNRVLFMLKDGSQAWEVKDFLIQQDRCDVVTIEGKDYPGKGYTAVSNHCSLAVASKGVQKIQSWFDFRFLYNHAEQSQIFSCI